MLQVNSNTSGSIMRYGFTSNGSFLVVDDETHYSSFAYASSPHAEQAKKNQEQTAKRMLASFWKECPAHIREEHYRLNCEELDKLTLSV